MSGQLRHAGNELPEFLHSDDRGGGHKSCGVNEYRHLQSQLHDPAACLQTAVLKEASRDDEKLARGFTLDMRTDLIHGGKARLAPQRLSRPVD
jgi:hypothetical protein